MNNQTILATLRDALAQLYDDADSAKRIATDAGVDVARIALTTHAINNWQAILREAAKANQLDALTDQARREYPANRALQEASVAYQHWLAKKEGASIPPVGDNSLPTTVRELSCPYRGLEAFEAEHAANYFGRETMVQKLLDKLKETNFIAVVGSSGSGKSSLVRAGLVTALRNGALSGSRDWDLAIVRPGEDPLRALAQPLIERLATTLTPVERLTETRKLVDYLRNGTLPIGDALAQLREQPNRPTRWLLIIDQFEEAFTLCTDEGLRRAFLETLLAMTETVWLTTIFTLRADFYGRILEEERFGTRVDAGLVNVLPMSEAERRAAIEHPALNAGRRFEEGLIERILDAVAEEPGELPLLEFALTELWQRQTATGLLTHAAYEEIGEVAGAIAKRADDTWRSFDPENQIATRRLFTRLVRVARPDEGAEDTKRRIRLQELDPATQVLVLKLADARLLVTARDVNTGEVIVEVAHEALIRNWQDLQIWLNGDREFLLWRQRLHTMLDNWVESGRDEGALLRGALLTEGEAWAATRGDELTALEQEFLNTSRAVIKQEAADKEVIRQRELNQVQTLASRQRWLLIAVSTILTLALASGWYINSQNEQLKTEKQKTDISAQQARQAEAIAVSAQSTAEANANLANQQLARLRGLRLYQDAEQFKGDGKVDEAIVAYRQAAAVEPSLKIDLKLEEADVFRQVAILLVQAGEALARNGDLVGAAAKYKAALDLNPPLDTPVYVQVEAGEFIMGSKASDQYVQLDEQPQHSVSVDELWVLRTEVTNWQYGECVKDKKCEAPDNTRWNQLQFLYWPVTNVTWHQANAYAQWIGGRLLTEAEWEKACRGTDTRIYPWGDAPPTRLLANFGYNERTLTDVGSYANGASPYGLLDMVGNVWEWTSSLYQDYPYQANDGRGDLESNGVRTLRGGSFFYLGSYSVRCAARLGYYPNVRFDDFGFRVVSPGF